MEKEQRKSTDEYEAVSKDFGFCLQYLRQAIEVNDKAENSECDDHELQKLL